MKIVELGKTGIETSYLGFGMGTHGWNGESDQTRIGHDKLVNLLKFGFEQKVCLWDSAEQYGSHPHMAEALKEIGHGSIAVITKTHSKSPEKVREAIPKFLEELDIKFLDIFLIHCIGSANWLTEYADVIEVFKQAKADGLVRAIGMSCHNFDALKTVASQDWIEVVLARINYDGTKMDAPTAEVVPVLEEIHDAGKGVIAMKVLGQGDLVEDVSQGIEFVAGLSCVDAMVIGMTDESQIQQNVSLVNKFIG